MSSTAWTTAAPYSDQAMLMRRLRRLRRIATLLDAAVVIPGVNVRIGWDAVLGLIPGGGDAISAAISAYIVLEASRLGVPAPLLWRMAFNIAVDFGLGTVPLAGDVFDLLWRANLMNVDLIERHFGLPQTV